MLYASGVPSDGSEFAPLPSPLGEQGRRSDRARVFRVRVVCRAHARVRFPSRITAPPHSSKRPVSARLILDRAIRTEEGDRERGKKKRKIQTLNLRVDDESVSAATS